MLHTTFARAKKEGACVSSYRKFAKYKGGVNRWGKDTPFPLSEVLEVCGLSDALWALRIVIEPADKEIRLFACDCAERVLFLFEKRFPDDKRPRQAIETARRYATGQATKDELAAARDAAWDATWDATGAAAWAARDAAGATAWAAGDAWTAGDAGDTAARAAWTAGDAGDTAWAAEELEWQEQRFLELLNTT